MNVDLDSFIKYEIDGVVCYWGGTREDLDKHIKDQKRRRKKSPNVVTLRKTGKDLKLSRSENRKYNVLTINESNGLRHV